VEKEAGLGLCVLLAGVLQWASADCKKSTTNFWFFGGQPVGNLLSSFVPKLLPLSRTALTPLHTKACRAGRGRFTSPYGALLQRGHADNDDMLLLCIFVVKTTTSAWSYYSLGLLGQETGRNFCVLYFLALSSSTAQLPFLHKQGGVAARQHHNNNSKASSFSLVSPPPSTLRIWRPARGFEPCWRTPRRGTLRRKFKFFTPTILVKRVWPETSRWHSSFVAWQQWW
jgi:hypothetical protein